MPRQKNAVTAKDFLAELEADFGFEAAEAMRQENRHDEAFKRKREQARLIADLAGAGVHIGQISDFLSVPEVSTHAYDVLQRHLMGAYRPWLLEWIGRSFGRKDAYHLFEELVILLKSGRLQEAAALGLACAISEIAKPRDLDAIIALVRDESLGKNRIFFVRNLMRSRQPLARAVLQALAQDSEIGEEVRSRLNKEKG